MFHVLKLKYEVWQNELWTKNIGIMTTQYKVLKWSSSIKKVSQNSERMEIVIISFGLLSFLALILRCWSSREMQNKEDIANNDFNRLMCCILEPNSTPVSGSRDSFSPPTSPPCSATGWRAPTSTSCTPGTVMRRRTLPSSMSRGFCPAPCLAPSQAVWQTDLADGK